MSLKLDSGSRSDAAPNQRRVAKLQASLTEILQKMSELKRELFADGEREFSQVDVEQWPRGLAKAIAVVRQEPEQLSEAAGIKFVKTYDDLDWLLGAVVTVASSGRPFALVRHLGSPSPGTQIWGHEGATATEILLQVQEALRVLGLSPKDVTWVTPEVSAA